MGILLELNLKKGRNLGPRRGLELGAPKGPRQGVGKGGARPEWADASTIFVEKGPEKLSFSAKMALFGTKKPIFALKSSYFAQISGF